MIEGFYACYIALFPWIVSLCAVFAILRRDMALFRCVTIVLVGQVAIDLWFQYMEPVKFDRQPYALSLAIYTASSVAASIRPSGKLCSTLGGVFIAGAAFSVIALAFKFTPERDYLFWRANVLIGVMTLAVILGGATGERGRRVCIAAWRGLARMVDRSRQGRLA